MTVHRYPRTRHLEGSALGSEDEQVDVLPLSRFLNRRVVVSEKIDGANAALSFSAEGRLLLQSRSRFLMPEHVSEGLYAGFHEWAQGIEDALFRVLGTRYVMYGEWLKRKQCLFYDALPQAFVEFDILDTNSGVFLSTNARRTLLRGLPVASAPVLADGVLRSLHQLQLLIGPSRFKTPAWRDQLRAALADAPLRDADRLLRETDPSDDMEGVVLKVEIDDRVVERAKYTRDGARRDFAMLSTDVFVQRAVENMLAAAR